MRVLHVLEAMGGGTRRHVLDLLPALQKRGVACTLAVSPHRNWPGSETFARDVRALRGFGVRVETLPMPRSLRSGKSLRALIQLQSEGFDVVHAHSSVAGALARMARAVAKAPVVYTPHCIAFETGLPPRQRRAARLLEQFLAPLTSHFIAVSQHEKRAILSRKLCAENRVSTIHNGVDLSAFDALPNRARDEFQLDGNDFVIGCFGRLTKQKNQIALVRALPDVLQLVPNAKLFFVGDGEDESMLRNVARNSGVLSRIAWAGAQSEARDLYALCDVVAQPSRWEGCPYVVLEAMAARKVVIARRVGGVGEIVENLYGEDAYGAAYPPQNDELAYWICEAAKDTRWRQNTESAARQRVEESFTLEQMVESTTAVYARCIGK